MLVLELAVRIMAVVGVRVRVRDSYGTKTPGYENVRVRTVYGSPVKLFCTVGP